MMFEFDPPTILPTLTLEVFELDVESIPQMSSFTRIYNMMLMLLCGNHISG